MRISDWSSDVCSSDRDAGEDARERRSWAIIRRGSPPSNRSRASCGPEHRLQHAETAGIRIQLHHAADGYDELLADVPDHRAAIGRDAERLDVVVEDLVQRQRAVAVAGIAVGAFAEDEAGDPVRSEEHTSELQSLMRLSYAVFCLKKKIRIY